MGPGIAKYYYLMIFVSLPDMQLLVDQVSQNDPTRYLLIKVAKGPVLRAWCSAMPWFATEITESTGTWI